MSAPSEAIGRAVAELATPALLIDADLLESNLAAAQACVGVGRIKYRPHTKSHKSPLIAQMQIAHGACGVCCAKLGEAEVMVAGGVADIHITTPVVGAGKARRLAQLSTQARVSVVVDHVDNVAELSAAATAADTVIAVLIEMDVGQGRCGVADPQQALAIAQAISDARGLRLQGMQGYQGKLQSLVAFGDRRTAVRASLDILLHGAQKLKNHGFAVDVLTGGGTGSLAIDLDLGGLTELQPGSYVFMDSTYRHIAWNAASARAPFANALTVLAGVVSRPLADRAVLDVGWKSASCDSGSPVLKDTGLAIEFAGDEHSLVQGTAAAALKIGAKVELIPSHCDTTVNLYDRYHVIRQGIVEAVWPIAARGRSD